MAIDFCDGWDDYSTTQLSRYWTSENNSTATMFSSSGFDSNATVTISGRNSSGSFNVNGSSRNINKTLASQASRAMGVAVKFANFVAGGFMGFGDGGSAQVTLGINIDGTLSVKTGNSFTIATVLGTTSLALSAGVWYYVEFKSTIHNISGSYTVNVNGTQWLSGSGANTRTTANNTANQIAVGCTAGLTLSFDDLYSDDAGTFYGDIRVESKLPTGDGASSQFTRSTGATNFSNVDENPATDDTDYNSTLGAGNLDLYTYPALTTLSGSVKAVMTVPIMRNDAAGNVTATSAYRSGGSNFFGATNAVGSTTYNAYTDIQVTNPSTSVAWTVSGVNAAQFGVKRVA